MIKIQNLDIQTNTLLIEQMSVNFEEGTINGISAPNGSGKSTLFRTISGLRTEKKGTIQLTETGITKKEIKKKIFYFENSSWFNPSLTGYDYLLLYNAQWKADKKLIKQAIEFWNMESYIHTNIKKYSLGMKQKLLLSLYIVSDATYWILDEPSIALDKASVDRLILLLKEQRDSGKCILFSAHESEIFFDICEHKYTIDFGVFKEL